MGLKEWSEWTKEKADVHTNGGCTVIPQGLSIEQKIALYHLDDYVVSSVNGVVVWLAKRNKR